MAMAALRSCVMSRIRSGVSRQLRVFDTKAKRRWEYVIGDSEWMEHTRRCARGELDDDEEVYYKDFPDGKFGDLVLSDKVRERTIDDEMFDDMYANEDWGDVDDEEKKELILDFMHYLEHVDIVPPDMTLRRGTTKEIRYGVYADVIRPPWAPRDDDWMDEDRRRMKLNGFYERN